MCPSFFNIEQILKICRSEEIWNLFQKIFIFIICFLRAGLVRANMAELVWEDRNLKIEYKHTKLWV